MTHQGAARLPGHGAPVFDIIPLANKASFATLFRDNTIRVSSESTLSVESILYGDTPVRQASIAGRGNRWAVFDQNSEIVVRELPDGARRPLLKLPDRRVDLPAICTAFALSPDGKKALWAGNYTRISQPPGVGSHFGPFRIVVWDVGTGTSSADDRYHTGPLGVTRFQFSEDGSRLAMLLASVVPAGVPLPQGQIAPQTPSQIAIVDPGPGLKQLALLTGPGPTFQVRDLAFNHSGTSLYAAAFAVNRDEIFRWSVQPHNPVAQDLFGERTYLSKIAISPDETVLAAGGSDGMVRLWDVHTRAPIGKFAEHRGGVTALSFDRAGGHVLSGGDDGAIVLWDVARLRQPREFTAWQVPAHGPAASEVWFAGDESTLIVRKPQSTVVKDGKYNQTSASFEVWDIERRLRLRSHTFKSATVPTPSNPSPPWHSRGGRLLVVAADDKNSSFTIVNAVTGDEIGKIAGPKPAAGPFLPRIDLRAVAIAPDDSGFALAESSGFVRVWSASRPRSVTEFETGMASIGSLAFSPKGDTLVVGGTGADGSALRGLVQFWCRLSHAERFEKVASTFFGEDPVEQIEFAPKGTVIAALSRSAVKAETIGIATRMSRLAFISAENRQVQGELSWEGLPGFGPVATIVFSPDDRLLLLVRGIFDLARLRIQVSLLSLETRTGKTLASIEDLQGRYTLGFPQAQPQLALVSERALRFFEPYTLNPSGSAEGPEWFDFPFAVSPMATKVAYLRGGTISVLTAAEAKEADAQKRYIRSCIESTDPAVCSYGLGAIDQAGLSPELALQTELQALGMADENVRLSALLRLDWDGSQARSAAAPVAARLRSSHADERVAAADALARLGDASDQVVSALHANLADADTPRCRSRLRRGAGCETRRSRGRASLHPRVHKRHHEGRFTHSVDDPQCGQP